MTKRTELTTNLEFRTCHQQEVVLFYFVGFMQGISKQFTKIEFSRPACTISFLNYWGMPSGRKERRPRA